MGGEAIFFYFLMEERLMKNIFRARKGNTNAILGGIVTVATIIVLMAVLFPVQNAIQANTPIVNTTANDLMYKSSLTAQNQSATTYTIMSLLPLVLGAGLVISGLMIGFYAVFMRN
jgi:hypothetical protein